MKANFTKFKVFINLRGDYKEVDIREILADLLYQNTSGIAGLELARKIYNSTEYLELDDKEIGLIKSLYRIATPQFIESFENLIKQEQ